MYRYKQLPDKRYLVTWEHGPFEVVSKVKQIRAPSRKVMKRKLAERYSFLSQGTSLHIIVVTLRCNQRCVYCHASSKPADAKGYDMDRKTAKKIVDFIYQSPSDKITIEFQGGEPLLNFGVVKYIVEYARQKKGKELEMTVVSNLTLMDRQKLDFLISNNVHICTSLDGPESLHNRNRPVDSYTKAACWIKAIQAEYAKRGIKNTRINALLTVTRESLKHPVAIIDEYVKMGLRGVHLRFLNKLGYGTRSGLDYSPEEYIRFWTKAMDHIIEINKKGTYFEERLTKIILNKIFLKEPNYLDLRSPCGAAIGQLAYNYDGRIYSCDEGRMLGEDIFMLGTVEQGYKDIISSGCGIVSASINDALFCDFCVYKPYCGVCPVCNYAEQGSLIAVVPRTRHCIIHRAIFEYVFDKLIFDRKAAAVLRGWLRYH